MRGFSAARELERRRHGGSARSFEQRVRRERFLRRAAESRGAAGTSRPPAAAR
jgi:hypothetical protein